ncbi:arabinose-5-phosphate isomerase [Sphingomonas sp. MM-1]|uniref:Arabinose 5-phosphate isomerase KdsD n=1 Tax=Edaphosphingomonas haloaromaticamans TaxID=653954 RepID=A0A1S1H8Y6_9SPHN|nr:arabinose-5-phosphate isomerase [Sphingomonas sp. MM-1]OHT18282.1 Arabinose 5-phosphate isomerase KdsD [Sphingomonas haloaromaticamans]
MLINPRLDARSTGASVIQQEAAGLASLAAQLDQSFDAAVARIVATEGRIIVAGMGKSGLICRKIAATLSATGSAAYFIHPAEASHGDLGSLKPGDTLLVLSNSGSTPELRPLVAYALALDVPVIAVASEPMSELMLQADIGILLPKVAEACPEKIAPTTSTAMMLALGDALAITAMQMRGISRDELIRWHPGGNIGWQALPVSRLIRRTDALPLVKRSASMRDVVIEMTSIGKGVAGVVDDAGGLIGIITDGDLRRSFDRMLLATAEEIMTHAPKTVSGTTTVAEARELMAENRITVVFVMDGDNPSKPAGLIHIHDLAPAA